MKTVVFGRRQSLLMAAAWALVGLALWVVATPFDKGVLAADSGGSTRIVDRRGELLREVLAPGDERRQWRPLREISPWLVQAVIHAEDKRFWAHHGVDPLAIARAVWANLTEGRVVRGASTLSQQVVKLTLHEGRSRSLATKLDEAVWAIRLDLALTKAEILEQYLNRAPFGNQLFGAEAASRAYFDKPASQLSLAEAAFLAGLPQQPSRLQPWDPSHLPAARERQRWILDLMLEREAIGRDAHARAVSEPLIIKPRRGRLRAPHFTEQIALWMGDSRPEEVATTLNLELQGKVEGIVDATLRGLAHKNVNQASVVVLDTRTSEVLAWVGSNDFWDERTEGANDGVLAERQPGSALKPFVFGLLMEEDPTVTPATLFLDLSSHFGTDHGVYIPRNFDRRHHGPVTLREALGSSLNIPAVEAAERVGEDALLERLRLAGMDTLDEEAKHYGVGLALGNGDVRLLDVAAAYAALGRRGQYWPARLRPDAERVAPTEIMDPGVAWQLLDILRDDRARAVGFGEHGPLALPFRVASKTGTSTDFRDNWAFGVTPDYTVGVWVGNFDGTPMHKVSSVTGAAPILRQVFQTLYPGAAGPADVAWFPRPPGARRVAMDALTGKRARPGCTTGRQEWLLPAQVRSLEASPATCGYADEVRVDTRNGLLAGAGCPAEVVERRVVHRVPPAWREWAVGEGMTLPPGGWSPLCPRDDTGGMAWGEQDRPEDGPPRIVHPLPGDRFELDPTLPLERQTVALRARAGSSEPLTWYVNGRALEEVGAPFVAWWQLERGRHVIGVGRGRVEARVEVSVR